MPALRSELVVALIRSLPKELRKRLVPVPEIAASVFERLEPRRGPLLEVLAAEIEAQRGVRIAVTTGISPACRAYLKMTFSVEDAGGKVIGSGQDLSALREQVPPKLRADTRRRDAEARAHGADDVDVRDDPEGRRAAGHRAERCARTCRSSMRGRRSVCGRSRALRRSGCTCASGTRRLLALTVPSPVRPYQGKLGNQAVAGVDGGAARVGRAVLDDAATAAISSGARCRWAGFDEASFARLRDYVAGNAVGGRQDHRRRRCGSCRPRVRCATRL